VLLVAAFTSRTARLLCAATTLPAAAAPAAATIVLLLQLDPCNAIVLNSHLVCAAKELPLLPSEDG
jgi:hypothetical protein